MWELVHSRSEVEGRPETVFQLCSRYGQPIKFLWWFSTLCMMMLSFSSVFVFQRFGDKGQRAASPALAPQRPSSCGIPEEEQAVYG